MDPQLIITQYLPGIGYLLFLLLAHITISTICHLKQKTFSFSEWPNYMVNFISYALFIGLVNGAINLINQYNIADVLSGGLAIIQGIVYGQVILYYFANIKNHLKELNQPVGEAVDEIINDMADNLKEKITKGDKG